MVIRDLVKHFFVPKSRRMLLRKYVPGSGFGSQELAASAQKVVSFPAQKVVSFHWSKLVKIGILMTPNQKQKRSVTDEDFQPTCTSQLKRKLASSRRE